MKPAPVLLPVALMLCILAWSPSAGDPVPYPEGYRSWVHVKSALVSPGHARFATIGGFQHIYANPEAWPAIAAASFPKAR